MELEKNNFLTKYSFVLLLIIPMATVVYYATTLPVSFDEAYTFLLFTTQGFWETMSTYPAPNNHVLHSLITNVTKEIPLFTDLFKLRISSILFNLLMLLVLFKFMLKHFNKKLALVVVAIVSMLFLTLYYGYMSRGYGLFNLFFIISLYCSFNIVKGISVNKSWAIFCVVSVLGFYTIPSFLYPFITLNVWILLLCFNKKSIAKQIMVSGITVVLVLGLYYPILSNQGIGAIVGNTYVKPIGLVETLKQLPKFYLKTIQEISGIHWIIMLCLLVFCGYKAVKSNDKMLKWFTIVFVAAPFVLLTIHCVIPFVRVFAYYGFIMALLVALAFQRQIVQLSYAKLLGICLAVQCLLLLNFERKIYAYEDKDDAINITSDKISQKIIGNNNYFFNGTLLAASLKFNLITKGYTHYKMEEILTPASSADTLQEFDYITIDKIRDTTKKRKAFITTKYYNIYKKE